MAIADPLRDIRRKGHNKLRNARDRFRHMKRIRSSGKKSEEMINHFLMSFGKGIFPKDPTFGSYKNNLFDEAKFKNILAFGYPLTKYPAGLPIGSYPLGSKLHSQQNSPHQEDVKS